MSIKNYLFDQGLFLIFFAVGLVTTSVIILLDPYVHIHLSNLLYLLLILCLLALFYLILDYRRKKVFYSDLKEKTESGFTLVPTLSHNSVEKSILQLLAIQKEQYNQEIEKLKMEQKEISEYMTSWVHEIKTPITISKMIFETEHGSQSLEEEMDKIEHLVDQALIFSRAGDFSKDYFIQETNVEQIVKEAIKGNQKLFFSKKIRLQLDLSPMEVLTDKKGLLFILNQILSNSLKYTSAGGMISIHSNDHEKIIQIRDNGIGIPNEDLPRIFDKGFTGKNGRQIAASTGMGLFLAKKITHKLGHELILFSEEGCYTEATIYFSKTVDLLKDEFYIDRT